MGDEPHNKKKQKSESKWGEEVQGYTEKNCNENRVVKEESNVIREFIYIV